MNVKYLHVCYATNSQCLIAILLSIFIPCFFASQYCLNVFVLLPDRGDCSPLLIRSRKFSLCELCSQLRLCNSKTLSLNNIQTGQVAQREVFHDYSKYSTRSMQWEMHISIKTVILLLWVNVYLHTYVGHYRHWSIALAALHV